MITGITGQDGFHPKTRAKFCWKAKTDRKDPFLEGVPANCAGEGFGCPHCPAVEAR